MITVYIISAIVFIITVASQWSEYNGIDGRQVVVVIFNTVVTWGLTLLFVVILSDVYIKNHKSELTYYISEISCTNIRTLSDNTNNITGNFALGFGSVNSESRFYFYGITSDSSFYLKSIKADGVQIFERNDVNPCVVKYEKHIDWSKSEISWWLFKFEDKTEYYYIYVPKNTVIKQYTLDAQ